MDKGTKIQSAIFSNDVLERRLESIYQDWYFKNEENRMEEARVRDLWYSGDKSEIETRMNEVFQDKYNLDRATAKNTHIIWSKDVARNISRLSIIYHKSPERTLNIKRSRDKKSTTDYNNFLNRINIDYTLNLANDLMLLHNTILIRFRVLQNRWKETYLDVKPYSPQYLMVKPRDDNYLIPEVVAVKELHKGKPVWTVESDEVVRVVDNNGNVISEEENEYGVLRWAVLRYKESKEDFWQGENADELVNQSEASAALDTSMQQTSIAQGFSIPLFINTGLANKGAFEWHPGMPVFIDNVLANDKVAPSISFATPNTNLTEVSTFEKNLREKTALNRNLPKSSVGLSENKANSGYQEWLQNGGLRESRENQLPSFRKLEDDIFHIIRIMGQKNKSLNIHLKNDAFLGVKFAEPTSQLTQKEKKEKIETELKLGLTSIVEEILKEDPELSQPEAINLLKNRLKLNSLLNTGIKIDGKNNNKV